MRLYMLLGDTRALEHLMLIRKALQFFMTCLDLLCSKSLCLKLYAPQKSLALRMLHSLLFSASTFSADEQTELLLHRGHAIMMHVFMCKTLEHRNCVNVSPELCTIPVVQVHSNGYNTPTLWLYWPLIGSQLELCLWNDLGA